MPPLFRPIARLLVSLGVALAVAGPPNSGSASAPVLLTGFPALKQQHSLTCESSAASMGTRGVISESQIMAVMPRNVNPNLGFRGNPDGEEGRALIDYGVYAAPVSRALQRYGYSSTVLMYASRGDIKASINRGWPVEVWIPYALQPAVPRMASANGKPFFLVPHEHVVLIVGYDGGSVFANDPWTGKVVRYGWKRFERSWGLFDDMALSIEPCPEPKPVTSIAVTGMSTAGLTWTWPRAKNAAQYRIRVIRHGAANTVAFKGTQAAHSFTLPAPVAGATYEIRVRSASSCGGLSTPVSMWVPLPSTLPQPTPTPSPSSTPVRETPTATAQS